MKYCAQAVVWATGSQVHWSLPCYWKGWGPTCGTDSISILKTQRPSFLLSSPQALIVAASSLSLTSSLLGLSLPEEWGRTILDHNCFTLLTLASSVFQNWIGSCHIHNLCDCVPTKNYWNQSFQHVPQHHIHPVSIILSTLFLTIRED